MRFLITIGFALALSCASSAAASKFAAGQVWRLKEHPEFADARVTIGAVERRGDKMIVHATVSDLPGPSRTAPVIASFLERMTARDVSKGQDPFHYVISGIGYAEGLQSMYTADVSVWRERPITSITIAHIVADEQDLRDVVSVQEPLGPPLHSAFDFELQLWRKGEQRWPQFNGMDLERSFFERLTLILRSVANWAADARMAANMGPPPPAVAEPSETIISDPALDARCREIVSPKPLSPKFVAELRRQGFNDDEIPVIDVTLSDIVVTSSERWGRIWRADSHNKLAPPDAGNDRAVCWRKSSDEQPVVTSYPQPGVGH